MEFIEEERDVTGREGDVREVLEVGGGGLRGGGEKGVNGEA